MKILYIYHENMNDRNMMSGTVNSIYNMLIEQGHEVTVIQNLKRPIIIRAYNKIKHKLIRKHNIGLNMDANMLRYYAKRFEQLSKGLEFDLVFAPVSSYYAFFKPDQPTAFFIDSNIGCLKDYYWKSEDFSNHDIEVGFELEKMALENTTLAIYASNWARDAAIKYHSGDPEKIVAINRGANVQHKYSKLEIRKIINHRLIPNDKKGCQLLFLGKDWERKGGEIACYVTKCLNEDGYNAKLIVIGCNPEVPEDCKSYVEVWGFLDKNKQEEYDKIDKAFTESDFFILPTQAECQGISYIEACAWGMPPIGCITGGVGDVVIEGITGMQLPTSATAEEYANKIEYYIDNPHKYVELANSAFDYYEKNMSWSAVGRRIFEALEKRIEKSKNKE